jgi:hypothetical protein
MILIALAMAALLLGLWMRSKALIVAAAVFCVLYLWKFHSVASVRESAPPTLMSESPWQPAPDIAHTADIHPSIELAAKSIAHQLGDKLAPVGVEAPKRIRITGPAPSEAARSLATALGDLYSRADVVVDLTALEQGRGEGEVLLRLEVVNSATVAALPGEPNLQGTLNARAAGSASTADAAAGFSSRAWAVDFPAFQSRHRDRHFIAFWSSTPATSADEALADARARAAAHLTAVTHRGLRARFGHLTGRDHARIADQVERAIAASPIVEDQFVQSFTHSFGRTWRAGVLLDVSPAHLSAIQRPLLNEIGAHHAHSRRSVFAIAGIAAVISLLYLFLNAATRGYFRSSLQWGAVAILVIGALMVMALA